MAETPPVLNNETSSTEIPVQPTPPVATTKLSPTEAIDSLDKVVEAATNMGWISEKTQGVLKTVIAPVVMLLFGLFGGYLLTAGDRPPDSIIAETKQSLKDNRDLILNQGLVIQELLKSNQDLSITIVEMNRTLKTFQVVTLPPKVDSLPVGPGIQKPPPIVDISK